MQSILDNIDERFEVVVVDNYSTDGTLEYLRSLEEGCRIRLILERCNRGAGREIALKNARGRYVIAPIDADHYFIPAYIDMLDLYIRREKQLGMFALLCGPVISTKEYLLKIGGWRPLQWSENAELYKRLIDDGRVYVHKGVLRPTIGSLPSLPRSNPVPGKNRKLRYAYEEYRDMMRSGLGLRTISEELWRSCRSPFLTFPIRFVVLCLSWIAQNSYVHYPTFEGLSYKQFLDIASEQLLNQKEV